MPASPQNNKIFLPARKMYKRSVETYKSHGALTLTFALEIKNIKQ